MTALGTRLRARIAAEGPLTLADYMAACLTDPEHGYYATRDPLGAKGDFITAPEVGQMFGEMIGLWLAQMWLDAGRPAPFTLAELGPGRGTLMADALRAARAVPGFAEAAGVVLVETSPVLRAAQARAVPGARHLAAVEELPEAGPLFVVANEFFDALPIRQFQRLGDGWAERRVGLSGEGFGWVTGAPLPLGNLDARFPAVPDGTVVEVNGQAEAAVAALARRGAVLLAIDYGDWDGTGDTLQAVRGHAPCDPFEAPGTADLTAHVLFKALAAAGRPLRAHFTTQGAFLERLGITARAQALAARGDHDTIAGQHRRLTHPEEMGTLFKVLALTPGPDTPPGFEA